MDQSPGGAGLRRKKYADVRRKGNKADVSACESDVEKDADGETEGRGRRQERKKQTHSVVNAY